MKPTHRLLPLALLLAFAVAAACPADDWPRFAGPNANFTAPDTGINKDWGANPPQELWRVSLTDGGYAGPSVADGKVFIIDHRGAEDVVRALALDTGETVWEFNYPDPGDANYGYARSTPCYEDGRLYIIGRAGQVFALNAADGTEIWQRHLQNDFGGKAPVWNYATSAIIDGDVVVVQPGGPNAAVATLNKLTGETVWAGGGSFGAGYSTPVVATINGTKQYVVFTGTALTGVKADDGTLLWQVPWETKYGVNAAIPIVENEYVFASSGYNYGGGVFQIGADGAQPIWGSKAMMAHFSSPIYYKDFIFGTTDPGDLICLAPADGTVVWRQGGFEKGGIVIVDDVIIGLDGKGGDLIMAEASTNGYNELGRVKPLGGQSWTAPIVADGKLLIRNTAELVCLALK